MSVKSMTGYGRGVASARGVRVEVELSSVNRKQMDISLSLPRSLNVLEPRIEEAIGRSLSRGRVTGEVWVRLSSAARQRGVCVDEDLAKVFVREIRGAARRLGLKDDLGGSLLLSLPDVVRVEHPDEDAEAIWPLVEKALRQALAELSAMRAREGRALQKDVEKRLAFLERKLAGVRKHAPATVERYREKLLTRLREAGLGVNTGDERVLKELALFADKCDISEEVTRLDSHIRQARKLMQSAEPVGRSLDFLAQEMFREINTTGSKANDGAIAADVVAMKAELERIREQVQNIE